MEKRVLETRISLQNTSNKEKIVEAIRKCAEKLGRRPTVYDLASLTGISHRTVQKYFGSWRAALLESGIDPGEMGPISKEEVFISWAGVVRELKKIPTYFEYKRRGKFGDRVFRKRFGIWRNVPGNMLAYLREARLEKEWGDVMEVIVRHMRAEGRMAAGGRHAHVPGCPTYAPLMMDPVMVHEPSNENGVLVLFGMMAKELGFRIIRVQAQFPDCEAYCEVEPGKWQRVRIEFEYESRHFVDHGHDVGGCDLIVCWVNNWPECPLKVIELKKAVSTQPNPKPLKHGGNE